MDEKEIPSFGIKRIKEFSFLINESLAVVDKPVRVQFQHHTTYYSDKDLVDLTLRVYYSYDTNIPPDSILVDFHVQNIFEIKNLKQYQSKDSEFILPQNLITSMLGVAMSHLRALMASNIAGTAYQENIIPIINPMEVAKSFYPTMFKDDFETKILEKKIEKIFTSKGGKNSKSKKS